MTHSNDFFQQIKEWNYRARAKLESQGLEEVCNMMFLIQGTSRVFGYSQIAYLAALGEDVVYSAIHPKTPGDTRRCIGCAWDVLTTLDYLIANGFEATTEEQKILLFRIEATLKSIGNLRPKLTQSEIDVVVLAHQRQRDIERSGR